MYTITLSDATTHTFSEPITAQELLRLAVPQTRAQIVACHVDHYLRPLNWVIDDDALVDWVDLTTSEGTGVYQSSLSFIFTIAVRRALGRAVIVNNSISEGLYWELLPDAKGLQTEITAEDAVLIKERLDALIAADLPITTQITSVDKASRYFAKQGRPDKARLLELAMTELPVELDECDGEKDMFWTPLVPSTGCLTIYELSRLAPGIVLRFPTPSSPCALPPYHPSPKLQKVFGDYADWLRKMHIVNMTHVWDAVARDGGSELILLSEALHAQQIARITEDILSDPARRIITIAGPSASGKTTTSHKLRVQLQVAEKHPIAISLDDYFLDRDKTPRDEDGNYDFETVDALNLPLLREQIGDLLAGRTVRLPHYNFHTGKSEEGQLLTLAPDDMLIIEGLHALSDAILDAIPARSRYGIYLSPLTGISLDNHTRTSTTDHRLLRRILRDHRTRGTGPAETIMRWPSVNRGAFKYIYPCQKNADAMFNTSLLYELPVLRIYAENLLRRIRADSPAHGEAMRLLRILRDIPLIDPRKVPSNSLLREFIGDSLIEAV